MKIVKIPKSVVLYEGGLHGFSLGNGTVYQFRSKKKALKFLSYVNKTLTQKVYYLRAVYMQTFLCYNEFWQLVDANWRQYDIRSDIESVERLLEKCVSRSTWHSGNLEVFIFLNKAIYFLKRANDKMLPCFQKNSNTPKIYSINNNVNSLEIVHGEINSIGLKTCTSRFRVSNIEQPIFPIERKEQAG